MYYVIMDLEWNNIYLKRLNGYLNEIIEIGAVMLDRNLELVDEFSSLIRSQTGRRLSKRVINLTHLSDEELKHDGVSFVKAMTRFEAWLNDRDAVFMTWGNGDLKSLIDNYSLFTKTQTIPFIKRYVDLQCYFQSIVSTDNPNQIGLSAAAERLGLEPTTYENHRALGDSYLTMDCLKCAFNEQRLQKFIEECDEDFYKRTAQKTLTITNFYHPKIDHALLHCKCDFCGKSMEIAQDWKLSNNCFKAVYVCHDCNLFKRATAKFTEYAGGMDVRLTFRNAYEITEEEQNEENAAE